MDLQIGSQIESVLVNCEHSQCSLVATSRQPDRDNAPKSPLAMYKEINTWT